MKLFPQGYRLFSLLSLDIAIGAVCMAYFISIILNAQVPVIYYILLGQVVWTIYLIDHLYDSRKKNVESYRRIFYKKHSSLLGCILTLNFITSFIFFVLYYNKAIIQWSIPAIIITCVYLLANWWCQEIKKPFYLKEFFIAFGYTCGVMVIPLSFQQSYNSQIWVLGGLVLCMALWNVFLIAVFEKKLNDIEGQTTVSQWMSVKYIKLTIAVVFILFLVLVTFNYIWYYIPSGRFALWIGIGIYMSILFVLPKFIGVNERYRRWAEQIFLLPSFYFLILKLGIN